MNPYATAKWDEEAGVYVSDSDVLGLVIEATTLDEFDALANDLGPQLIEANGPK